MDDNKMNEKNPNDKIKIRQGSGYLKQLYSTARTTVGSTQSNLNNRTTFLVNFVPVEKIDASELQVRTHFDPAEIEALANSVKQHGVLQPILVVQDGDRYKVIAGERRLRASKQAGLDRIPARVLSTDDKATHEIALRENLDRVDLHPIDEGEGYVSLLEAQAYTSHEAIAKAFGKPKSRITECIGYTRLPDTTKGELLARGIKNRSLLRELMTAPESQHLSMIADAKFEEEQLIKPNKAAEASSLSGTSEVAADQPARAQNFEYRVNDRGVMIPKFSWKAKEPKEKLSLYADSLKKVLAEIEALISSQAD